jgi:hypothetical protein
MSLNLVRNNSSSPFRLQRSMVDQGGEGGAYESGGYTGKSEYSDGGMGEAISSFGKVVGAGIQSRTAGDENKSNEKKAERLEARAAKTEVKKQNALKSGNIDKADRMKNRGERVEGRLKQTNADIAKYKESQKPTLKSDIKTPDKKETKPVVESAATAKIEEERQSYMWGNDPNLVDPNN